MSTDIKAPSAGAMQAADQVVAHHDVRQRKHDCPGFDCVICSLHADESTIAQIIDQHVAELVEALEALSFDVQTRQFNTQHLHAANQALRRFKEGQPSETDEDTLSRIGKGRERQ